MRSEQRSRLSMAFTMMLISVTISQACLAQKKYFPEHPRVQETVNRGIQYIENIGEPQKGDLVLAALTIVETRKRYDAIVPVDHPLVKRAAKSIVDEINLGRLLKHDSVYYPCLSLILLCDLGDEKYRKEILALLENIVSRQEPSGAFTYEKKKGQYRGDTSQTQYVALALWVAHKHGFIVPEHVPQRALDWLLKVNQPNGTWFYEYKNDAPIARRQRALSIQAAGLGTVYLLADFLQLNPQSSRRRVNKATAERIADQVQSGLALPPSVSVYVPPKEGELANEERRNVRIDRGRLSAVKSAANQNLKSDFEPFTNFWGYYYLYALERYAFFRERAEGSVRDIPDWYDQCAMAIFDRQKDDGSFRPPQRGESNFYATCFAILFLVRSSEVLVAPSGEGPLAGGLGLKPNVRLDLAEGGGRIKSFDVVRGLEDVMDLLSSEAIDEQQFELIQDSLSKAIGDLSNDKSRGKSEQIAFMRGLVSDRNYFRRLIAVQVLSRQQDLDNVPALIYALGDPDLRICAEAHNGLRLISRRLDSIQISDEPDYSEYQSVKRKWKDWYLKIRPGAKLLD